MRFPFLSKSVEQDQSDVIRRSVAPVVEMLERRTLMSLSFVVSADSDGNSKLVITSNNSSSSRNETLNITEDPDAGTTTLSGTGISQQTLPDPIGSDGNSGFEIIEIFMKDGDDTVNINVTSDYRHDRRSYLVDLGEGSDDALYNARDLRYGTSIDMEFDCDGGNDDVSVTVGTLSDSSLVIEGHGDAGSDDFIVNIDDVGEIGFAMADEVTPQFQPVSEFGASTVDIEIDGSSGNLDTINTILDDVRPDSFVTYDLKLGTGNDKAGMTFNGVVHGELEVNLAADSGNDEVKVQLNQEFSVGSPLVQRTETLEVVVPDGWWAEGSAAFNLNGNDGNDKINVVAGEREDVVYLPDQLVATQINGNGSIPIAHDAELRVRMIGGTGNDYLTLDFASDAGVDIQGLFYLRMDGSHQNDTMLVRIDAGYCSSGTLDGDMRGGNGDDKLYLFLDIPILMAPPVVPTFVTDGPLDFGPAGYFLQDGGTQYDRGYTELNGDTLGPTETIGTPIHRRNIENILLIDPTVVF